MTEECSELEVRAFNAANAEWSTEDYQQLVRDLWRACCDGSEVVRSANGLTKSERDYYIALSHCLERYSTMARESHYSLLGDFLEVFRAGLVDCLPIPKLCRWLGYIQGVLISEGITTVDAERDWTRPYFRPLDFPND